MNPEALAAALDADGLVFLCSGNMVRSAFADLYAKHIGCSLPVRSGATIYRNDAIFPDAEEALLARGVDLAVIRAFRPTHIDDLVPGLEARQVFLGMRMHHLDALAREEREQAYLIDR